MRTPKFILLVVFYLIVTMMNGQNIDSIQQKVNYYISQAQLDSAKLYIESSLKTLNKQEDKTALNYQLVKVFFIQSSYDKALKQAFNSLDSVDDEAQKVKFNFMIGAIYSAISDYDKSIEYFNQVVTNDENPSLAVQTHLLLSDLYLGKKDSINAGKSLAEAYKITRNFDVNVKMSDHVNMQYNFFNKNYEICKQLNFKTIKDSTSFLNAKSYAYSMIGDCLIKQDSLQEATAYFDEFLKLTFETKDPEQIKVAANKLIKVYETLGDQEKANAYHKIYNEAENDSLSFSVEKYRDLYDIEKNRELNTIKAENSRKYLIFGAILLLLIFLAVYYYFKSKKKVLHTAPEKTPSKKITISDSEVKKMAIAIDQLKEKQLFLTPNITRKSFCSESNIKSERYLSQYINENYKKSFSVFINDLRIEYAYNRIQNDKKFRNYKIEEIAKACGFGSKKSFERVFSSKYNETPYKLISKLTN